MASSVLSHPEEQEKKSLDDIMAQLKASTESFIVFPYSLQSNLEEDLDQQQEVFEEAEVHKEEESSIEEEELSVIKWSHDYYEKFILENKTQEIETTEQEEDDAGTCSKNLNSRSPESSVGQLKFLPNSRLAVDSESPSETKH